MKDTINRCLTYGCSKEMPEVKKIKQSDLSFEEAKEELLKITHMVIDENISDPDNTIFQCSGGVDSSIIISKFQNVNTFSTTQVSSSDYKFSKMTSDYFKTTHQYVREEELIKDIDIESSLIEMNKIHSMPRSYINDLGLYSFVKRIKEQTDIITGGEGIEIMYLGYSDMYTNPLNAAMWYNEYDRNKANLYGSQKKILQSKVSFDPISLLNTRKLNGYSDKDYFKLTGWWTGFNERDINNLGLPSLNQPKFNFFDYINYVFSWFGEELYFDRRLEYADHFKLKWISPYLDKRFMDFSLSLPIEMRNCCGQIKYIMYESLGHMIPRFIIDRPKEGLVLSFDFYLSRKDEILKIVDKYLNNPKSELCNYLEFSEIHKIIEQFKIQFDFDYLRKVWMLLNLELWMIYNKRKS